MPSSHFSPFGKLLVPVESLTLEARLQLLRADLAAWRYGRCDPVIGSWLAAGIEAFLGGDDGDLGRILGLRPVPGSTTTAARIGRLRERDALLLRLAVAVGSDARARRVVDGDEPCPKRARPLMEALKEHPIPTSKATFNRARVSCHRR